MSRFATPTISIVSGKGGVGKSILGFNLAERLSVSGLRVVLIDTDLACGTAHILANCSTECSLWHLMSGEADIERAVTSLSPCLSLVSAAPVSEGRNQKDISVSAAVAAIAGSGRFDIAVVDHPSGMSDATEQIASHSHLALLVVVPELTSIANAYGLYKRLVANGAAVNCRLLINRIESTADASYIRDNFAAVAEQFLGRSPRLIGSVSEDVAVRQSLIGQRTVYATDSMSPAAQELTAIAREVLSQLELPESITGELSNAGSNTTNINLAAADIRE